MPLLNIKIPDIDVGERGRKDLGDLSELCDDIRRRGLICPIAVIDKEKANFGEQNEKKYLLAAGGRRLAACTLLDWESIDCRVYDQSLTEYDYRAIELFENIRRKDLSYQEDLDMKSVLDETLKKLYGTKTARTPDAPGHSMSDTAEFLGIDKSSLSKDLSLKKTMDTFPDIDWTKCKNKSDASKLATKLKRTAINAHAAERIKKEFAGNKDSFKKHICDSYIVGDFFEKSKELPDEYFDFAEIDPPYAINLKAKKKGNSCDGYNEIDATDYISFMERALRRSYQKLKPNSWLVCWFGPEPWFASIRELLEICGFQTTSLVGIWAKGQEENDIVTRACGQTHMPNSRLANSYEMFYYAWKGKPQLNRPGTSNLFGCIPISPAKKWHPTQRPRPLMRDILKTFAAPGSKVLVPFAGSGETIISADKENMTAIGFDLESTYKDSFLVEVRKEF